MRRSDFAFDLPAELIAQQPLAERSQSRLLALDIDGQEHLDLRFDQLPDLLNRGDLLVFNDTKVLPARVQGTKPSGGRVEIFLERPEARHRARVQLRASKPVRAGQQIHTAGGTIRVLDRAGEHWLVELPQPAIEFFEAIGETPLPPYIERPATAQDRERYQSIFARLAGAVAAPTASLHFDERLLAALTAQGVEHAFITLHVGAGTFAPMRVDDVATHVMHAEYVEVGDSAIAAIQAARARGGRVIAVGTTVVRSLEAAAREAPSLEQLRPFRGDTRIFIYPGFTFRLVEAMITNFHLPESTLLMLVSAFVGRERILAAYRHAIAQRYRFFSYGDAMFLTRGQSTK